MPPLFTIVVIGGAILAGIVFLLTRKRAEKSYHPKRHHYEDAH